MHDFVGAHSPVNGRVDDYIDHDDRLIHLAQRTPLQRVEWSHARAANCQIWLKRDDLVHHAVSGNKLFKLFHPVKHALSSGCQGLISFGGRHSNHLYALAKLSQALKLPCAAIVRGDEINPNSEQGTLLDELRGLGMQLQPVARSVYRQKNQIEFLSTLRRQFPSYYIIPEGGEGLLGAQGFADYALGLKRQLQTANTHIDSVWLACGTGTTLAGLATSDLNLQAVCALATPEQQAYKIGIEQLTCQLRQKLNATPAEANPVGWHGFDVPFGKLPPPMLATCVEFWRENGVLMDPIYGAKVLYALHKAFANGLRNRRIVVIHTGGVQGWRGFSKQASSCPGFCDTVDYYLADRTAFLLQDSDLTLGLSAQAHI